MRARTAVTITFLAFLAGLAAGTGACGSRPADVEARADGQPCGASGNSSCLSDHCSNGFCCRGGNCCGAPSDCPASFRSAPACPDRGATTTCQGARQDATCTGGICGTEAVGDDSACAGATRDCTPFKAVACDAAVDQPPAACLTACASGADCAPGFSCAPGGQCVPTAGLGQACSGTGQGTCNAGLKCENEVCCGEGGATCCTASAQCAGGLACDTATSSACFTTCTDGEASRCASASTFCQSNACVDKLSQGTSCSVDGQCSSGVCAQGVCCDRTCGSACQSCNDPSSPGTRGLCTAIGDDTRCGTISCQGLNGQCRRYADVTANRCLAGSCKPPNDTGTCTSWSDGDALCGPCQKCAGGSCVNQLASEDLKNECAGTCLTGTCNGAGACGFSAPATSCSDGVSCSSGDVCDGAGHCAGAPYTCAGSTQCRTVSCDGAGGCTTVNGSGPCGRCGTCSGGSCLGDCAASSTCCFPGCAPAGGSCP